MRQLQVLRGDPPPHYPGKFPYIPSHKGRGYLFFLLDSSSTWLSATDSCHTCPVGGALGFVYCPQGSCSLQVDLFL